jgi:uncharacterized protein
MSLLGVSVIPERRVPSAALLLGGTPWGSGTSLVWTMLALLPPFAIAVAYRRLGHSDPAGWALLSILGHVVMGGTVAFAACVAGWRIRDYLALTSPRGRDVALALAAQALLFVVFAAVAFSLPRASSPQLPAGFETFGLVLLLLWLANVVVGPICEEIVFRGFLYRGLAESPLGPWCAVVISSGLFAVLHFDGVSMIWHYCCGLLYGWLRWRSRSTAVPIVAHVFNNGMAAAVTTWMAMS